MHTLPKVSPAMLDALLWFYQRGNWDHIRTGTSAALVERKLVGHSRIGIKPDLINDDGVAVLLAHGRLAHKVGDTVREARSGEVGTVTEVNDTYVTTTVGRGGVAAYLPVSKLPTVWREENGETDGTESAEAEPAASDTAQDAKPGGLEKLHTDRVLILLMRSVPGENVRRRRAELLLQLPTPADRVKAVKQAHDASTQLGGPDLVDALADIVAVHPAWRPVSCGGRYLPCRFNHALDEWGVFDTETNAFVEIGGAGITRWMTFEHAVENALSMSGLGGQVLAQKAWDMSVVRPGDLIEGKDVSIGGHVRGAVVGIVGPVRSPDCGGYRYLIRAEAGRRHVVFAERWI